jgi:magnesium-transporting ATPase (P-type)
VRQHGVRLIRRIGNQLRDPLILLLLAAVVMTVAIGDLTDAAVIALVIVVNTTVGQKYRLPGTDCARNLILSSIHVS